MLHIGVFASGKGSNVRAILGAIATGAIPNAQVVLVLSNNSDAGVLALAREHRIPALHIARRQFASDNAFNRSLLEVLENHGANFIVLAGYMKKIDPIIIHSFRNRILNIHPALLPEFGGPGMYGMRVHEAVIGKGSHVSGATVHLVDEEYDHGAIVLQKTIDVDAHDTPETLAARVLCIEHELYPEAIRLFAEDKVRIDGQRATILS